MTDSKLILVIGATGAQGLAVIDSLIAPHKNGEPSPYTVRALTRNIESDRAKQLLAKGVEVVKGDFMDFLSVLHALKGVYGAWVNTDGFTVGEMKETYAGIRIFELAKQIGTVRHFIWSNLDYVSKKSGYDPKYKAEHYDGKGRVADFLQAQPSVASDHGMTWSIVTTGPYMDMLNMHMLGPLNIRSDGTFVFATPVGKGHVPMIALTDLGYFARYSFDNRELVSGKDLEVATEMVGWDHLVETFTRVTGQKAVVVNQSVEEWLENLTNTHMPIAGERTIPDGSTTRKENFAAFWRMWRDDIIKRDMEWIREINPKGKTLESWMIETRYTGRIATSGRNPLLKNLSNESAMYVNTNRTSKL